MKSRVLCLLLLLGWLQPVQAVTFETHRLQAMAQCLNLPQTDTLQCGEVTISYNHLKHTLRIAVNDQGAICHIGLQLFSDELRQQVPSPIYDFLERDLLERLLVGYDEQLRHQLHYEHLSFIKGSARTALTLDGTEEFRQERVDFRKYRTKWIRNGSVVFDLVFDMDVQLLSGCNALELEQRYLSRLRRFNPFPAALSANMPDEGDRWVEGGDSLFIKEMSNAVYFERTADGWHLVDDDQRPTQTLANMLLSPAFERPVKLRLTVKRYTYEDEQLQLPYAAWLQMAVAEGCEPYFGIKYKTAAHYEGTVILANRLEGYAHLLSLAVPQQALYSGTNVEVEGRLYLYIPLHNVASDYFVNK